MIYEFIDNCYFSNLLGKTPEYNLVFIEKCGLDLITDSSNLILLYPEIQAALAECINCNINHTKILLSEKICLTYKLNLKILTSLLYNFFDAVYYLVRDNFIFGYKVCGITKLGKSVYQLLNVSHLVNPFIKMLHLNSPPKNGKPSFCQIIMPELVYESNDGYIKYINRCLKHERYLTIPFCGYKLEDFITNNQLSSFISQFKKIVVLFMNEVSAGVYLFN